MGKLTAVFAVFVVFLGALAVFYQLGSSSTSHTLKLPQRSSSVYLHRHDGVATTLNANSSAAAARKAATKQVPTEHARRHLSPTEFAAEHSSVLPTQTSPSGADSDTNNHSAGPPPPVIAGEPSSKSLLNNSGNGQQIPPHLAAQTTSRPLPPEAENDDQENDDAIPERSPKPPTRPYMKHQPAEPEQQHFAARFRRNTPQQPQQRLLHRVAGDVTSEAEFLPLLPQNPRAAAAPKAFASGVQKRVPLVATNTQNGSAKQPQPPPVVHVDGTPISKRGYNIVAPPPAPYSPASSSRYPPQKSVVHPPSLKPSKTQPHPACINGCSGSQNARVNQQQRTYEGGVSGGGGAAEGGGGGNVGGVGGGGGGVGGGVGGGGGGGGVGGGGAGGGGQGQGGKNGLSAASQGGPFQSQSRPGSRYGKFDAHRYYYGPRQPLPLPTCFHNPTGYPCCNPALNDLIVEVYTEQESKPRFHTCNINLIATMIQHRAEERFNSTFESVVAFDDFAEKIHFRGDFVCKVELGGKYMLAYATVHDAINHLPLESQDPFLQNSFFNQVNEQQHPAEASGGPVSFGEGRKKFLHRKKRFAPTAPAPAFIGPLPEPPLNDLSRKYSMWV